MSDPIRFSTSKHSPTSNPPTDGPQSVAPNASDAPQGSTRKSAPDETPLSGAEQQLVAQSVQRQKQPPSTQRAASAQPNTRAHADTAKTPLKAVPKQDPIAAQARIDRACRELQLPFQHPPIYGALQDDGNLAETDASGNTALGDRAFANDALLRSVLVHEQVHQQQVHERNFAKFNTSAGNVNEVEAYRAELLPENLARTQLPEQAQRQVGRQYLEHVDNLLLQGNVGREYAKQVLLNDRFDLRPQDRLTAPTVAVESNKVKSNKANTP